MFLAKQNLDLFHLEATEYERANPRNIVGNTALNIRRIFTNRQKKRGQAPERNKVIQEEVEKLVDARIMKEVHYHSWLSNPVMVKKHDGTWRMCVYIKILNNACPKDCYPLPKIDWKVESLYGYLFKCFLDAYKGYHQIKMAKEDEEKMAFITSQGNNCYAKMLFGLKKVRTTYQRLVDKHSKGNKHEIKPKEMHLRNAGRNVLRFEATNNEAEYEALIAGLRIAKQMGVKNLQAHVDSKLVANQVNDSYIAKESGMVQYLNKVKTLAKSFKNFHQSFAHLSKQVLVEELKEKSINEKEILDVVEEEGNTSMTHDARYYWPTMHMDARNLIRECNDCQIHRPVPRNPQQNLTPITSPWPFYKWGIDIAGPFPEGPDLAYQGKLYQTMENSFVIIHSKIGRETSIRQCFASVKHPQANGLVERANRSLGEGIKEAKIG
ncbi:reverse transcriptase domain-containing protein [Tanacetum coccineum]